MFFTTLQGIGRLSGVFKRDPIKEFGVLLLLVVLLRGDHALVSGLHKQGAASDLSQGRLSDGACIPQPAVGLNLICSFPKAK